MKTGTRFTAKNTCLRLYLAWLDHNRTAKIVGPAPAQWMGSLLSPSVGQVLNLETKLASITSLSASRVPPPPGAHHWSEQDVGWKIRASWLAVLHYCSQRLRRCFLIFRFPSTLQELVPVISRRRSQSALAGWFQCFLCFHQITYKKQQQIFKRVTLFPEWLKLTSVSRSIFNFQGVIS